MKLTVLSLTTTQAPTSKTDFTIAKHASRKTSATVTLMPFDVSDALICEMESKLGVTFPAVFHEAMSRMNGGSFDGWELYPVADPSTRARQSSTHNDIIFETREAQDWDGLPEGVIALAGDGFGDQAVVHVDKATGKVSDEVRVWSHETGEFTLLAASWVAFFEMRDARTPHVVEHVASAI